jgi:hypothetical protein
MITYWNGKHRRVTAEMQRIRTHEGVFLEVQLYKSYHFSEKREKIIDGGRERERGERPKQTPRPVARCPDGKYYCAVRPPHETAVLVRVIAITDTDTKTNKREKKKIQRIQYHNHETRKK